MRDGLCTQGIKNIKDIKPGRNLRIARATSGWSLSTTLLTGINPPKWSRQPHHCLLRTNEGKCNAKTVSALVTQLQPRILESHAELSMPRTPNLNLKKNVIYFSCKSRQSKDFSKKVIPASKEKFIINPYTLVCAPFRFSLYFQPQFITIPTIIAFIVPHR